MYMHAVIPGRKNGVTTRSGRGRAFSFAAACSHAWMPYKRSILYITAFEIHTIMNSVVHARAPAVGVPRSARAFVKGRPPAPRGPRLVSRRASSDSNGSTREEPRITTEQYWRAIMEGEEMGARMEREDKKTFRKPEGAGECRAVWPARTATSGVTELMCCCIPPRPGSGNQEDLRRAISFDQAGPLHIPSTAVPLDQEGALDALRMGTWRLRGHTCSQIEALVAQIEGAWRTVFGSDFRLYQLDRVR